MELIRFFFALPEPVALPDGFQFNYTFDSDPPQGGDPHVQVTFRQTDVQGGRMEAATKALLDVMATAPALPDRSDGANFAPGLQVQFTVIDAVTVADSPDAIPAEDADHPRRWTPRSDALTRCVAATERVLRAHRQATESTYGLLSYVRLISPVLSFTAPGTREMLTVDGVTHVFTKPVGEWSGPSLVMLDHTNLADPFMGKEWDQEVAARFDFWLREQERGNPLNLWRERYIEANRAVTVTGDLAQAVLLTNTSSEVLLDVILALLHWEDQVSVHDAAPTFEQGKTLRRITTAFPSRLRGNWSTKSGVVGDWYNSAYRLRHRIIHGGYTPTATEAHTAFDSATALQGFIWGRIAASRTRYPRAALMTLGISGLEKRGLWSGQIRKFSETVAPTEPSWANAFTDYYRDLMLEVFNTESP